MGLFQRSPVGGGIVVNHIWFLFMVVGIVYAAWHGQIGVVTQAAVTAAESAVALAFKLIGVMCLWLGLMKIAERAGMIRLFSVIIGPVVRMLFPSIPRNHPALGNIILTLSANLLGLGNAATPFGIKAMQQLQQLNSKPDVATEAMCTLLALCTTGFTLIPATMIALRSAAGSAAPADIVGVTVITSLVATFAALTADFVCRLLLTRGRR
ncbi:nucleoside recognition domain-containing protein [Acetonema longum]|uniref:Nucleoside recognition n=1 Tax=Acetonema longum DSM 6540 TaxID=1009370 RepID=F7NK18_9FIRM|nr:nucleoside recognition domain-containing protein [Acetonema longum]EGO63665.1 nucleoside recognition [Acetonema longum DSM 6540]